MSRRSAECLLCLHLLFALCCCFQIVVFGFDGHKNDDKCRMCIFVMVYIYIIANLY